MRYSFSLASTDRDIPRWMGDYLCALSDEGLVIAERGNPRNYLLFPSLVNCDIAPGRKRQKWHGIGTVITKTFDSVDKIAIHTIHLTAQGVRIQNKITYKTTQSVIEEGLIGYAFGDMDIKKDQTIHVEGDAVAVGFLNEPRVLPNETLGDANEFGIYTDYGHWQADKIILEDTSFAFRDARIRNQNETRQATVHIGRGLKPLRVLCQPNGYDATYALSNHADGASLESTMAIMYGASDESHPNYGRKGMVSRGLKGTWSAFALGTGLDYVGFANDPNHPDYLNLLLRLQTDGMEIIPHSISEWADTREMLETYLPQFDTHFSPIDWQDHGLGAGVRAAGLTSEGWNPESEHYMMDLLEHYGYKYGWSYQDELMNHNSPGNQWRDSIFSFPNQIVFQNDALARPNEGALWQYTTASRVMRWLSEQIILHNRPWRIPNTIESWVEQCGVVLDHDYLAWLGRKGLFHEGDAPDPLVITDGLDSVFDYISQKVSEGRIWNPTISEFCAHFSKLTKVHVKMGNGYYKITNNSGTEISGCSFLIGNYEGAPYLNGNAMNRKTVKRGLICWADLPEGESELTQ